MEFCDRCKKNVETFSQRYNTIPQDEKNEVRRYKETFCVLCGTCIHREVTDDVLSE